MKASARAKIVTVDDYFQLLPIDARKSLEHIRTTIKKFVPDATEKISYGMPTFFLGRVLFGYAAFTNHCSVFRYSKSVTSKFAPELSRYETSAGTIRFPSGDRIPASLIKKIVLARIAENTLRDEKKKGTKKSRLASDELPTGLAAQAVRALTNAGITTLSQLSILTLEELKRLHGIGPNAMALLRRTMKKNNIIFKSRK